MDEEDRETGRRVSGADASASEEDEYTVLTVAENKLTIPRQYEFINHIGNGAFSQVVECQNRDTREAVVAKLPTFKQDTRKEVRTLRRLMEQGADQSNIVKFFGSFETPFGKGMIFEKLDMSIGTFWWRHHPLPLSDIRTIIQQVATALEEMCLIHTDLHMGNIMICDHNLRPLTLKVIDFGLAVSTAEVTTDMNIQPVGVKLQK
ncbi:homeodomain-interacting protein kinase 1-like [Boleophthalmus pectinirostris]|uniref:homeodomain-interacting protein kinase 1-like n=1 Tax=Boleophthalmus pectinirostris TaxID=150288 RepID=UPI00242ECB6A|nr:homeodomain-interacting protein kinase 1-like [Boleophthalmus pectinirostris]